MRAWQSTQGSTIASREATSLPADGDSGEWLQSETSVRDTSNDTEKDAAVRVTTGEPVLYPGAITVLQS